VTPPIDPDKLKHFLKTLPPEKDDPYEYLSNLRPQELLKRRVEITEEIKTLEEEKTAIDVELLRSFSDAELRWGVRGSGGWVLRQRTRTSWQYPPTIKEQIQTLQKTAQRSGDATELTTTYLVMTREES
jgi:hypothetical protein